MRDVSPGDRAAHARPARIADERTSVPAGARRPPRDLRLSAYETLRLVADCADDAVAGLGCRPVIHADWPDGTMLPACAVECVVEAVDAALLEAQHHIGVNTVVVTLEYRADTVEVCVVDNGWHPDVRRATGLVIDDASGVERGIEEYEGHGTCQWWSIPFDVEPLT
jgi:hypothetical protein